MPSRRVVSASRRRRCLRCSSSSLPAANLSSESMMWRNDHKEGKMAGLALEWKHRMYGKAGKDPPSTRAANVPDWYRSGWPHVWLPYAQMKTATPPLPVVRTEGSRIVLADGRQLID